MLGQAESRIDKSGQADHSKFTSLEEGHLRLPVTHGKTLPTRYHTSHRRKQLKADPTKTAQQCVATALPRIQLFDFPKSPVLPEDLQSFLMVITQKIPKEG